MEPHTETPLYDAAAEREKRPFTMKLFDTAKSLDALQTYCRGNNLVVSDGLILRALIQMGKCTPELLGIIEMRKAQEAETERRGKGKRKSKKRGKA